MRSLILVMFFRVVVRRFCDCLYVAVEVKVIVYKDQISDFWFPSFSLQQEGYELTRDFKSLLLAPKILTSVLFLYSCKKLWHIQ